MGSCSEVEAQSLFAQVLREGEESLYPVYCVHRGTGFFTSSSIVYGYITCTNQGRIITAGYSGGRWNFVAAHVSTVKDLKIKKNLVRQYIITGAFPMEKKDYKIRVQIAPKVLKNNLPNQKENLEKLIAALQNGRVI